MRYFIPKPLIFLLIYLAATGFTSFDISEEEVEQPGPSFIF
jgi:hypothetical protein